jgi:hypothetical protein
MAGKTYAGIMVHHGVRNPEEGASWSSEAD